MFSKLLTLTVVSAIGVSSVIAQESPTAPKDKTERKTQSFVFSAPFERSYLGVQTVDISKENYSKFGLSQVRGVGVEKVSENSPAAKAGLQTGDVIVRFEGEEVKSVSKLTRLITEVAPDQTAKVTVLRGGGEREFTITMGKRETAQIPAGNFGFGNFPELAQMPKMQTVPLPSLPAMPAIPRGEGNGSDMFIWRGGASRQIGVGVAPLTKQLSNYFGVAEGRGLLINDVRENSPAAAAGLRAGDVIIEINGREVKGQLDLIRAISEKKEGDVSLTIIRDKNRQTVRVTPETSKDSGFGFSDSNNIFEFPGGVDF